MGVVGSKDEDASKHGGGSVAVHPSIRYRGVVKSKLKAMHAKEVVILNQYKDRWPSLSRLWQWRIVRNVWTCSATELHGHMPILLHLTQFCIRRQTRYQPYGPWPHVPESVWAHEEATIEFVANCVVTVLVIYPSVALAT